MRKNFHLLVEGSGNACRPKIQPVCSARCFAGTAYRADQGAQHLYGLDQLFVETTVGFGFQVAQATGEPGLVAEFPERAEGDIEEAEKFSLALPAATLDNVRRYRHRRPAHLRGQAVHFAPGKVPGAVVGEYRHLVGQHKGPQFGMISHRYPLLKSLKASGSTAFF